MVISKEIEEFLKSEKPELEWRGYRLYQTLAGFSERILSISPDKALEKKYKEAIDFCHIKVSPRGAFSLTIGLTILTILIPSLLLFLFSFFSPVIIILILVAGVVVFFYFYNRPFSLATSFRIKASSEMVLAIVYMTIAMKVRPNLEHGIKFAAANLKGPLGFDLRKLLWDIYVGKFVSMDDAIDFFAEKWKRESEEFTGAISLIKTAFHESPEKMDRMFNEAVDYMLEGTKDRMKGYARSLRTPVTVVNALGFLLPMVGLMFLPLMAVFLSEVFQPAFITVGYCVLLPGFVYWMMSTYLEKRPYTFHQPDVSKHPKFRAEKQKTLILISILIPLAIISLSYYFIRTSTEPFGLNQLLLSLLITLSITGGIVAYCIVSTVKKLKLRDEIVQVERELGEVLFILGNQLSRGKPIENALEEIKPKIKDLKIAGMFEIILYNIKSFGMNFEQAVFNKDNGAVNYYPSTLISAVMKAVVEISRSGMSALSRAMTSIAVYLKDMNTVEENLHEILDETVSSMEMQALILAPIASGVVVALTSMVMKMLVSFGDILKKFMEDLSDGGAFDAVGLSAINQMINVNKIMPVSTFQIIVGVYMIEVVSMLAVFLSTIRYGEESILKKYSLGKKLLISVLIYSVILIFIYLLFTSVMSLNDIGGVV